jgi:hypothetical protein
MLEPYARRPACTVLRGRGRSNASLLPDQQTGHAKYVSARFNVFSRVSRLVSGSFGLRKVHLELFDENAFMSQSPSKIFIYEYPPEVTKSWKSYPIRLVGPRASRCHNKPTLLVQSMGGGYVSANCSECGGKDTLSPEHPEVDRGEAFWMVRQILAREVPVVVLIDQLAAE